jgi:hypothetical protein
VGRKLTSYQEFTQSLSQACKEGKDDLKKGLTHPSPVQVAKRIGMEAVGLTVGVLFLPFPGPNPAWFISPTSRAFFRGFMRETGVETRPPSDAPQQPPQGPPDPQPS